MFNAEIFIKVFRDLTRFLFLPLPVSHGNQNDFIAAERPLVVEQENLNKYYSSA